MFEVKRYSSADCEAWNRFVALSKNGTFLLDRGYMDYHADRFQDHSFMVYRKGSLYALLPACLTEHEREKVLHSHAGLTYGGLILNEQATIANVCEVFQLLNERFRAESINRVIYKPTPWIYHRLPAEEDLYALHNICHASILSRDASSVILEQLRMTFTESRLSGLRKARSAAITVKESHRIEDFWNIINDNLRENHNAKPVHTAAELRTLANRFPKNIRLYTAEKSDTILGGGILYETPQVVHTQYISASSEGKRLGVLDMLFDHLIHEVYANVRYFDFGTSTMRSNGRLNTSLIFQKEGFGGRTVCYDTYEWIP